MKQHLSLWSCLTLILALCLTLAAGTAAAPAASEPPPAPPPDPAGIQGMWVWQARWFVEDDQRAELLDFCERYGFNRLLVQIHTREEDGRRVLRHPDELARLAADAAERGIAVEALDGAKDMAVAANQPLAMEILDVILTFNATLPEDARLVGIHYDIEPYLMDQWKAGDQPRQVIMHDLLTFYHRVREKLDSPVPGARGMLLSADIPFWYDSKTEPGDSCMITFNGERKNLHEHIQDVCDYVGIMSYRRHATGPNSVVEHVATELAYAEKIGKVVCPALETVELRDVPQITFFGTSAAEFWMQHNLVRQTLGDRRGVGGMLTHSYRGLRDLLEEDSGEAR